MTGGERKTDPDTERRLAVERERADLALSAAGMGEFEWEVAGDRLFVSPRAAALTGVPYATLDQPSASGLYDLVHPEEREDFHRRVQAALNGPGRFESPFRLVRPDDGRVLWMEVFAVTVRSPSGAPERVIGVVRDISARKSEEDAREALVAELDHRVKNVLAAVQSLAAQSARRTVSLEIFLKEFAGRLDAMAAAHTLLTATRWRGADIGNIAAAELGGLAFGQARWEGPEILLKPKATNALTLALHELGANALKYGALSVDGGRVDVSWTLAPSGDFTLVWSEHDGPPVTSPTRRGFGITLLERVTGRELGGAVTLEFLSGGLRATITGDASAVANPAVAAEPPPSVPASAPQPETEVSAPKTGESAGDPADADIRGVRILIVEDAVLLALELETGLTDAGAEVVGVAVNLPEALRMLSLAFDVAVLDVNLNGQSVTPVADLLARERRPFIFATGYGAAGAAPEGFDAPLVRKPYNVRQIAVAVAHALQKGA